MKKFLVTILTVVLCCMPLCACSTDFSTQIDETMDGLYQTLYNSLELFFKDANAPDNEDSDGDEGSGNENAGENENGNENVGGDVEKPKPEEPKYEIGTQVGQKLPSYAVQIFDENGLTDDAIDPSALGKVTVINFWGTWCPPCVGELPEFSKVASEYKDDVTIVAIHSVQNFNSSAVTHIKNNFSESDIIFAKDDNTSVGNVYYDECYETFGGNGYYPYTIILNEKGVITYAKEGALSEAALISKIEEARGN